MNSNPTSRNRKSSYLLALALVVLVLTSLACRAALPVTGAAPVPQVEAPVRQEPAPAPAALQLPAAVADEQGLLITLYQRINPSVVNLTIYANEGGSVVPQSRGSGWVYDADGHIVTNAHVVHGADQIEVSFADNTVRAATLVGEDLNADLAVVQVENLPADAVALPLADFDTLAVGETVIAIGNPFGLDGTLTRGIISALGRNIPALTQFSIPQAIQTDAAINPGNSGGPLLNLEGQVIGVNAQIETGGTSNSNSGVGFAIPVSIIQRVVPGLIADGEYIWPWMGVRGGDVNPTLIEAMKLSVERGAYLSEIISGGPADKAGLRGSSDTAKVNGRQIETGGDVIIAIDGQPVASFDDVLIYVALQTEPGQEITLTILRDGQQQDVTLKLEARPKSVE
jgi:2-alkenal reductase